MSVFLIFLAIAGMAAWIFANSSHITAELASGNPSSRLARSTS
jgi:hypothetical protein